jgi:diaminohydroxyphosphoribosylaminopyrimidine deaminase/5-amino-6-(5-phosphoribosylamino)uracil reductase
LSESQQHIEAAMRRALELALLGPTYGVNPQVGAVIIDGAGQIVAEGYHLGSGTKHAEIVALEALRAKLGGGPIPTDYTLVVTLEPCNHTGKTGPCAEAIIAAGVRKVAYASTDPGEASGGGAQLLREDGINVIGGVLAKEADEQGRVWLTAKRNGRPFVTLKWASSLDGRAAAVDGTSRWISGPASRAETHVLRNQVDAILVGTGTVLADDPELTARRIDGSLYDHQPLRVVLGETEIPTGFRVYNDAAETVFLNTHSIHGALAALHERGIKHILVEGGPTVASKFIKFGLVDEYLIYLAPKLLGGDMMAIRKIGVDNIDQARGLIIKEVRQLGDDIVLRAADDPATKQHIRTPKNEMENQN